MWQGDSKGLQPRRNAKVLKGHGFSRAEDAVKTFWGLQPLQRQGGSVDRKKEKAIRKGAAVLIPDP